MIDSWDYSGTKVCVREGRVKYGVDVYSDTQGPLTADEIQAVANYIAGQPAFRVTNMDIAPREWWPHFRVAVGLEEE
jgi:hypothetical protein